MGLTINEGLLVQVEARPHSDEQEAEQETPVGQESGESPEAGTEGPED